MYHCRCTVLLLDPSRKMPEGVSMDVYNNDLKLEKPSVGLIRENRDQLNHESLCRTNRCRLCRKYTLRL